MNMYVGFFDKRSKWSRVTGFPMYLVGIYCCHVGDTEHCCHVGDTEHAEREFHFVCESPNNLYDLTYWFIERA